MAFDTQTVTLKGAELLAAATAADPLIIVGCDATQTYLTQAQAVNISTRPATPLSNTTSVTQLGSATDHINSRVYFRAGDNTGGDANTLMLYGHKQSAPSDNYVIFVASAQTPFHLPVVGDVVDEWETALDIVYTISTNSVGYATQATYCSLSEFNLLKERTVTTHKEGYPTTGDPLQTIYGNKTFKGYIKTDDTFEANDLIDCRCDIIFQNEDATNSIRFVLSELPEVTITATDTAGGTITTTAPMAKFSGDVTVDDTIWVTGSAEIGDGCAVDGGIYIRSGGLTISTSGLNDDWEFVATVSYSSVAPKITLGFPNYSGSGNVPEVMLIGGSQSSIELTADGVDVSNSLSSASLYTLAEEIGTSGSSTGTLAVYGSVAVGNTGTSDGTLTVNGTTESNYLHCAEFTVIQASKNWIEADNTGLRIYNSSSVRKVEFETDGTSVIDGTLSVSGAVTASSTITATGLVTANGGVYGLAPEMSQDATTVNVPIGGIVFVWVYDLPGNFTAGMANRFNASTLHVCAFDNATGKWVADTRYVQAGLYCALATFVYSSSGNGGTLFPVMRVAD